MGGGEVRGDIRPKSEGDVLEGTEKRKGASDPGGLCQGRGVKYKKGPLFWAGKKDELGGRGGEVQEGGGSFYGWGGDEQTRDRRRCRDPVPPHLASA